MPADPIKVLLADDHTLFRNGLAGLLASYGGMEVVGSTPNGEDAVALVERTRPDVVLMQVQIPFERAKDILTKMRAVSPPPKVVIVTMFESPRYLRELMGLGASAYLIKSASTQHLIGAIRAAVFDPQGENVVVGMPRRMLEEARKGSRGVLSARELEILLLAARGLPVQGRGVGDHHLEVRVVAVDRQGQRLPVHEWRVGYQDSHILPLSCGETSAEKGAQTSVH